MEAEEYLILKVETVIWITIMKNLVSYAKVIEVFDFKQGNHVMTYVFIL